MYIVATLINLGAGTEPVSKINSLVKGGGLACLEIDFCDTKFIAGRLQKGDQLLESNGTSLMGVSNER